MSTTVTIPGGTAELFDRDEITPRRQIPLKALYTRSGRMLEKLTNARRVINAAGDVDERPELEGPDVLLTEHESEIVQRIQYATTWAWLKSWTLPLPLPANPDAFLDIPAHIVDALDLAVQKHYSDVQSGFEMSKENLEDKDSFTGASEKPKTRSGANAKRRTSTRKTSTS